MNVLSLFDGISCGRVALERAGLSIASYTAVEIEKNATAISKKNYPDIIRHGDVRTFTSTDKYDLLIGGSPCTDLSIAKKNRQGLEGNQSSLFWEYVRIKNECEPTYFILENVASMPKKDRDIITETLGVEPVLFNASLVSAQCRKRLFWTNIPFELPDDRGILLKDILQPDGEVDERMVVKGKSFCLTATYSHANTTEAGIKNSVERKQRTLVFHKTAQTGLYEVEDKIRKLTPIECERLQGLPDNYTEGVAMTHRYKCLGNAFNVDVVCCIVTGVMGVMGKSQSCP